MTRPLDPGLLALAQQQQVRTQYAFQFTCEQIEGATWNFTSPQPVGALGVAFAAVTIALKDHKEGGEGKSATTKFTIEMEPLEPFLSLVGRGLPFVWNASVYEVYFDAEDTPYPDLVAEGQLVECAITPGKVALTFEPQSYWMQKKVPLPTVQLQDCRMPWGPGFGVNADDFGVDATALSVDRNIVYSAGAALDYNGIAVSSDYYRMGYIRYYRTIAGQSVTLQCPVITNVVSQSSGSYSYFILAQPPYLLSAEDGSFRVYPGYDPTYGDGTGSPVCQALGTKTNAAPTYNFYSHVLQTIQQIMNLNGKANVTSVGNVPTGSGNVFPLYASHFTPGNIPAYASVDAVNGTVYFTSAIASLPGSMSDTIEMKWQTGEGNIGFLGFPQMPTWDPVTTSQVVGAPPPSSANLPQITGYFNDSPKAPITAAYPGQVIDIEGINFQSGGSGSTVALGTTVLPSGNVYWGAISITVTIPDDFALGTYQVTVTTSNNTNNLSNPAYDSSNPTINQPLSIVAYGQITGFFDANGNNVDEGAVGQVITISGSGFGARSSSSTRSVTIGSGAPVTGNGIQSWADTAVTFIVPNQTATPPQPYPVTVANSTPSPAISITSSGGLEFEITGNVAQDLIDHYENQASPARPITSATAGQVIYIKGSGFGQNQGTITFPGLVTASSDDDVKYNSWSNPSIKITLPTPTTFPWTGQILLQTAATDTLPSIETYGPTFTIGAPKDQPWIDHFETNASSVDLRQTTNTIAIGASLWIIGENFGGQSGSNTWVSVGGLQIPTGEGYYQNWGGYAIEVQMEGITGTSTPGVVIVQTHLANNPTASSAGSSPAGLLEVTE